MNRFYYFLLLCLIPVTAQTSEKKHASPASQQQQFDDHVIRSTSSTTAAPQQARAVGAGWSFTHLTTSITDTASAFAASASALAATVKDQTVSLATAAKPKSIRQQIMTSLQDGSFGKRTDELKKEADFLLALNHTTQKIDLSFTTDPATGRTSDGTLEHNRLNEVLTLLQLALANKMTLSKTAKENIRSSLDPIRRTLQDIDAIIEDSAESKTK